MNRISLLAALCAVFFSLGAYATGIEFQDLSLDEALEKAQAEQKPIFIDIYATWCGPCKYLSREVFVDEDLGAYMNEHFINLKLNGEEGDGDYLMAEFGLDAFPTMLFLSNEKRELDRIVGAVEALDILEVSKGVIDPTSTKLFQLKSKYEAGDRDKVLMHAYINELIQREEDFEPIVEEYLKRYPKLDLEDEDEFLIFCIGVNDLDDTQNRAFLDNFETHYERFPELTRMKVSQLLLAVVEAVREDGNSSRIDRAVESLTPPLNKMIEEGVSESEVREYLEASVNETE